MKSPPCDGRCHVDAEGSALWEHENMFIMIWATRSGACQPSRNGGKRGLADHLDCVAPLDSTYDAELCTLGNGCRRRIELSSPF
jgi:hypothetical protein